MQRVGEAGDDDDEGGVDDIVVAWGSVVPVIDGDRNSTVVGGVLDGVEGDPFADPHIRTRDNGDKVVRGKVVLGAVAGLGTDFNTAGVGGWSACRYPKAGNWMT